MDVTVEPDGLYDAEMQATNPLAGNQQQQKTG
jgi:hypothetical protein